MSSENLRRLILAFVVVVMVGGIVAVNLLDRSENQDTRKHVTKIEAASPCLTYGPKSAICRKAFSRAIKTVTPAEVCVLFKLVDEVPLDCRHIAQEQRESAAKEVVPPTGNSPTSLPGPPEGGPTEQPVASTPTAPASPPESSAPEATHPIRETVESVTGPVKEAVCSLPVRLCP